MQERIVSKNEAGQRLDKLLAKYLKFAPQGFLYKMLRKKNITLNAKKACGSEKVEAGDVVRFFLSDETLEKFTGNSPDKDSGKRGTPTGRAFVEWQFHGGRAFVVQKFHVRHRLRG